MLVRRHSHAFQAVLLFALAPQTRTEGLEASSAATAKRAYSVLPRP